MTAALGTNRNSAARFLACAGAAALLLTLPLPGSAQYFGRNKVQYEDRDFMVLTTRNLDIYFYPEVYSAQEAAIEDVARLSERWYERYSRFFQHNFGTTKPLIIYADQPDFQQTNTLQGAIGQGTGGVTESLKDRVIMPLTASYRETNAVLGHELVHAFQYDIAKSQTGAGMMRLASLPLWLLEGTAEYLSLGREHPHTAMWLRDHLHRDEKPDLVEMTRNGKYFPYRFGQGFISYLGGIYGDESIAELYRTGLQIGWEHGINEVFGLSQDSISAQWWDAVEAEYRPMMAGRTDPYETGDVLLCQECGGGRVNVSPSLSPDGRYIVYWSERDLFSMDLYLADVESGRVLRPLQRNESPYIDGIRYMDSGGSWAPDSRRIAFVVMAGGNHQLAIMDVQSSSLERIEIEGLGALQNPAWSPNGREIAFTGLTGGVSDLYVYEVETGNVRQLTSDKHADLHPAWAPDGSTLAFVSDRGAETNFDELAFSNYVLAFLDVETLAVTPMTAFAGAKHTNPIYDATGEGIFFLSDPDGFPDVYHMNLVDGTRLRLTHTVTGVSGITPLSPALTYSPAKDLLAFSVFHERGYIVNTARPSDMATRVDVMADAGGHPGRMLPPGRPGVRSRIADFLGDQYMGLVSPGVYTLDQAQEYRPSLELDYVGQPSIGVGADSFGSYVAGGAYAYFSDMLGDRTMGVSVLANGSIKDVGGQVFYLNQKKRWNWGVGVQHTPYLRQLYGVDPNASAFVVMRERIYIDALDGLLAFPLSATRRIEGGVGVTRYGHSLEQDTYTIDAFGRVLDFRRENLPGRNPLHLASASVALVGDNSFSAFTSPVRGHRYRFGLEGQYGTVNFQTLTADYRQYFNVAGQITLAFRGLHLGRYGNTADLDRHQLGPFFLGYETFIRGYAYNSYNEILQRRDCQVSIVGSNCSELDRLFGHRLGVGNAELRIPFTGIEEFGLIAFPYIAVELVAFSDIGMAWDSERPGDWTWARDSAARIPLASSGFSARMNVLGLLILETYYAYPWQRPEKGWHWGFQIAPGW